MIKLDNKRVMIVKTNQLGDVTFALPVADMLKEICPSCQILFLGRSYTKPLIEQSQSVDEFVDWEKMIAEGESLAVKMMIEQKVDIILPVFPMKQIVRIAKKAGVPIRVGTYRRLYNWRYCNRLINVSRKKSPLHESQLDMRYLQPFTGKKVYSFSEIIRARKFKPFTQQNPFFHLLDAKRFNLILHPKTRGQKIEWSIDNFKRLIEQLPANKFNIFLTGSADEGAMFRAALAAPHSNVTDLTGKMTIQEMMGFIAKADGLIAASTGPVHLAANFGIRTLGLYAPIRPFHAGRWGPIGAQAEVLCVEKKCNACQHGICACINEISVQQVVSVLQRWHSNTNRLVGQEQAVEVV